MSHPHHALHKDGHIRDHGPVLSDRSHKFGSYPERKGMGAALQTETLFKTLAILTLRPCNGLSSARS
ncbi:hypothetical protein B0T21DRAFT_80427 [Apiosordaria backusii]|uniref:Uncharacterized protein n=1 Tax=Apiosordaria backusii TaxID=314023 RepID=A0AA40DQW6_9PEZI|nr:hypothetical protein B0T21DRAFT_80427 [Apiosordaria backusii]